LPVTIPRDGAIIAIELADTGKILPNLDQAELGFAQIMKVPTISSYMGRLTIHVS
jgi:hypothetical protein